MERAHVTPSLLQIPLGAELWLCPSAAVLSLDAFHLL